MDFCIDAPHNLWYTYLKIVAVNRDLIIISVIFPSNKNYILTRHMISLLTRN